jgi:hypothetical protein
VQAGPELVHLQPLIGPHDSSASKNNTVVNKIPSSTGIRGGGTSGSGTGGGSEKPIVIQNHLHMNEREIASIVSETTANIGNRRQRHFR